TSVYGVLTTLAEHGDNLSQELRADLIRTGVEQGERLKRLLEELLDLSRLDSRGVRVDPKPLVLGSVLSQIVTETIPGGPRIEIDVPDTLAVVADRLIIDRVVSNLLTNAARYGQEPITLSGSRTDMHVRIAVEDSGPGVADEVLARLFERFARADSAVGSGLGLSIARAYARAHGGDLVYEQRDRGARFELILPQQS
ncbi:MAG TPA: ATP-binding protein, partial [Gaiellaceae bacterium]|nr:ATP-binding protein [Gaiellaceae bacterium]